MAPSTSIMTKTKLLSRVVLVQLLGSDLGRVTEDVLGKLLQVAVSDPFPRGSTLWLLCEP